jgi:hypothetical protein
MNEDRKIVAQLEEIARLLGILLAEQGKDRVVLERIAKAVEGTAAAPKK